MTKGTGVEFVSGNEFLHLFPDKIRQVETCSGLLSKKFAAICFAHASAHNTKCGPAPSLSLSLSFLALNFSFSKSLLFLYILTLFFSQSFYIQFIIFSFYLSLSLTHSLLPAHIVASFIQHTKHCVVLVN